MSRDVCGTKCLSEASGSELNTSSCLPCGERGRVGQEERAFLARGVTAPGSLRYRHIIPKNIPNTSRNLLRESSVPRLLCSMGIFHTLQLFPSNISSEPPAGHRFSVGEKLGFYSPAFVLTLWCLQ